MTLKSEHWETVYQTKDHQQVGWFQKSPDISLALLTKVGATPEHSLIDVGCGASMLVDHLLEGGFTKITLLDLSAKALSIVKQRLGHGGNIPQYLCQDVVSLPVSKTFDIWHDRAVFHFLTEAADRKGYLMVLNKVLAAGGRAIIGTFSIDGPKCCSGLDVVQYDREKMASELPPELEIEASLKSMHVVPSGAEQEFIFFTIRHR